MPFLRGPTQPEDGSLTSAAALWEVADHAISTGGKQRLLGISKRGDAYLRTLLIHGARSVIAALKRRLKAGLDPALLSRRERWLLALVNRRNINVAAVALANKNVRTAWALLAHGKPYEADHVSVSPRALAGLPG
jgi:transposase